MTYVLAQATATHIPLGDESVQCVVTSPPYWGLRSYAGEQRQVWGGEPHEHEWAALPTAEGYTGTARWQHSENGRGEEQPDGKRLREKVSRAVQPEAWGQIERGGFCSCGAWYGALGLEPTPELYAEHMVAIFREVRRVLRPDGTLWINLGDSYAGGGQGGGGSFEGERAGWRRDRRGVPIHARPGLKPKDLVGIPWSVAKALQAPYYTGRIGAETDRVWLAAMIDGEGCMFLHKRKIGQNNGNGYKRKADSFGAGLEISNTSEAIIARVMQITGQGSVFRHEKDRRQPLFRWNLRSNQCRDVVREVYPYLVGKQHQARLLLGCPSSGPQAEAAHSSLIALHNGGTPTIDFGPPASMYEPGWYLRSDIIWSKNNPMPESVTDRPTKSHEHVFLLSKSSSYYYDADAIREPIQRSSIDRISQNGGHPTFDGARERREASHINGRDTLRADQLVPTGGRNARSVWMIATQPYPGAHFATYPEALAERCILAGSARGDVILDPFTGSGTTGRVALRHGRRYVGLDVSREYLAEQAIGRVDPIAAARVAGRDGAVDVQAALL